MDVNEFQTIVVLHLRGHFVLRSYALITMSVLEPDAMLVERDPRHGHWIACCLVCRSAVPEDGHAVMATIKTRSTVEVVDLSPTGFKCWIHCQPHDVAVITPVIHFCIGCLGG